MILPAQKRLTTVTKPFVFGDGSGGEIRVVCTPVDAFRLGHCFFNTINIIFKIPHLFAAVPAALFLASQRFTVKVAAAAFPGGKRLAVHPEFSFCGCDIEPRAFPVNVTADRWLRQPPFDRGS